MKFVIEVDLEIFQTVDRLAGALAHMVDCLDTIPPGVDIRSVLQKNDTIDFAVIGEMMDDKDQSLANGRAVIARSDFNTDVLHRKQAHLHKGVRESRVGI